MYSLRALTGIWMAAVLVSWSILFSSLEKQSHEFLHFTTHGFWRFTLIIVLAGLIPACLYGASMRALVHGTRQFHLVSIFPAAFPHIPLLWLSVVLSQAKWFLATALVVLLPALYLTARGWFTRRPGLYLTALAAAGIPCTVIGAVLSLRTGLEGSLCWAIGLWYAENANVAAWMSRPGRATSPPADSALRQ